MKIRNKILIGNGPSCLDYQFGDLIDSFDIVVRFNHFKIKGFEKHVGTKTDVWVIHDDIGAPFKWEQDAPQPLTIRVIPHKKAGYPIWEKIHLNYKYVVSSITARKMSVLLGENPWPSTGAIAIEMFRPCYIFGFDNFKGKTHYFDDTRFCGHSPLNEEIFINNLVLLEEVKKLQEI